MWLRPSRVRKLSGTPSTSTVSPRPPAGSTPQNTAKSMISIRPCQKFGVENPTIEPAMINRLDGA